MESKWVFESLRTTNIDEPRVHVETFAHTLCVNTCIQSVSDPNAPCGFFNMPTHMVNCVGTPSKTCFHNQQYEGNIVWRSWGPKGRQSSGKRKSARAGVVESFEWRAVFLFLNYLNLQLRRQLLWFLSITHFYKRLFSYRLLSSLIAHHVVTFFPHTILLSFLKTFFVRPAVRSRETRSRGSAGVYTAAALSLAHLTDCHP